MDDNKSRKVKTVATFICLINPRGILKIRVLNLYDCETCLAVLTVWEEGHVSSWTVDEKYCGYSTQM